MVLCELPGWMMVREFPSLKDWWMVLCEFPPSLASDRTARLDALPTSPVLTPPGPLLVRWGEWGRDGRECVKSTCGNPRRPEVWPTTGWAGRAGGGSSGRESPLVMPVRG